MKINKDQLKTIIKYIGTIVFVYILVQKVAVDKVFTTLKQINLLIYSTTIAVFLITAGLNTLRWKMLLKDVGIKQTFQNLFELTLISSVINFSLPSFIGGDAAKIFKLADQGSHKKDAFAATLADRILGFSAILILAVTALLVNYSIVIKTRHFLLLLLIPLIGLLGNLLRAVPYLDRIFTTFTTRIKKFKLATMFKGLALSLITQIIGIINQYLLLLSLSLAVPFKQLFLAIPVTRLLVSLPVSIGGFGIKELTLIRVLKNSSLTNEQIISFSTLGYLVFILLSLFIIIKFYYNKIIHEAEK
jgi:hypothetical protein